MSTLDQIRSGLSKAWDSVTEGWRELRELAGDALTRFQPKTSNEGGPESAEERIVNRSSRWGLLASEVVDDDAQVRVMIEVPGMDADDIDLEVHDNVLVVRGEKRIARDSTVGHYHVMERAYGTFERAIRLPARVDSDGAQASYNAGVLTVVLQKSAGATSRRIKVVAG